MQDSLQDMLPVATALHASVQQMDVRRAINFTARWIQQIPYQDLSDRRKSSGASFSPPLRLLRENRGDCDSKAVLLAGLIRMLLPDIKLAMVYLPNHAVLAMQMTPAPGDMTVSIGGAPYVLIDATGPALLPVGEISPQYRPFTQSGNYCDVLTAAECDQTTRASLGPVAHDVHHVPALLATAPHAPVTG